MFGDNTVLGHGAGNSNRDILVQLFEKVSKIDKKLCNIFRFGVVTRLKLDKQLVRVSVDGEIDGISFNLPWCPLFAGDTISWEPPQVGEQVVILSPNGNINNGIIVGKVYQDKYNESGDSKTVKTTYRTGENIDMIISVIKGDSTYYSIDIKNPAGVYEIKNDSSSIKLTKEEVSVKSTSVKVECTNAQVKAVDTKIESTNISLKGIVNIEGATTIKGAVNIEGATNVTGVTNVSGAFTSTGAIVGATISNSKGPIPQSCIVIDPQSGSPVPVSQP